MIDPLRRFAAELPAHELELLALAEEAAPLGTWERDLETKQLRCSAGWYRIHGLEERAEWIPFERWLELVHPEDREATRVELLEAVRFKRPFQWAFRIVRPGGEVRWLRTRGRLVGNEGNGPGRVIGVLVDGTEWHHSEEALRKTEKLAASGRLATTIAHEINNPLEAMGNLLYLAGTAESLEGSRGYVRMAQEELMRVARITAQTLRFQRQSTEPTMITVSSIFDSLLPLYEGKLRRARIELHRLHRTGDEVRCMEGEMRQVFANLVANAIDAMPTGGRLHIRSRPARHPRSGWDGAVVVVCDTGHGMTAETRRKIWDPFYTTKGSSGTGLGLWVSREILRRHRASVWVKSWVGERVRGTAFGLFLPRHIDPALQAG